MPILRTFARAALVLVVGCVVLYTATRGIGMVKPSHGIIAFESWLDGIGGYAVPDIFVADLDASLPNFFNITRSTAGERNIVWSPDSTKIAFSSFENGQRWLRITDITGNPLWEFEILGSNPYVRDWSPDGEYLLMQTVVPERRLYNIELFHIPTNRRQILISGQVSHIQWLPNSNRVAFSQNSIIYVTDINSTPILSLPLEQDTFLTGFTASHDGQSIAFSTEKGAIGANTIFSVEILVGEPIELASWDSRISGLTWSLTDDRLFFVAPVNSLNQIFSLDAVDGIITQITDTSYPITSAVRWSPLSDRLLFIWSGTGGSTESTLSVINADGTNGRLIISDGREPVWRP